MALYRIECLVTIVLVNHWTEQWVIPNATGVQVPQYFCNYVKTLPLRYRELPVAVNINTLKPMEPQREAYYRVDVSLPSTLFEPIAVWLHTGQLLLSTEFSYNQRITTEFVGIATSFIRLLDQMMEPWGMPVPSVYIIDFKTMKPLKSITNQWNAIHSKLQNPHDRNQMAQGNQPCFPELAKQLREQTQPSMPQLTFEERNHLYLSQAFIGGTQIYQYALMLLEVHDTILEASNVWSPTDVSIPEEIQSIAQLISLNKKISVDEALAYCLHQPLDPTVSFWSDIETHIGKKSWELLQTMHQEGRLDVKKPTMDDFLDQLPAKLDETSRAMVKKAFDWAENVYQLTKPIRKSSESCNDLQQCSAHSSK